MSTTTAAKKIAKAAPAKTAAKRTAKAKAASPETAVAAFAEGYRAWWHSVRINTKVLKPFPLNERIVLCTLAGCANPGPGHRYDDCEIRPEIQALMSATPIACMPGLGLPDRTGAAAALLIHRLSELTA